jgi:1-acyl-sn-glycerol-3-phosphate acyltransferase
MPYGPSDLWYDGIRGLSLTGLTLFFSLRLDGARHVPRTGPALLIANHQSFLDPVLVGAAVPRHLRYLARETLFRHRALAGLMSSLNAVPIDQEGFARAGLKTILDQLAMGRAVLVFPEGERTHDGRIHPLRPGIRLLVKRGQAPVVPVGIAGAYEAWPRHRPVPVPAPLFLPAGNGTLAVAIGRPLDAKSLTDLPRERLLDVLLAELLQVHGRAEQLRRKSEG